MKAQIGEDCSLVGWISRFGVFCSRVWDEGWGDLFILRDSMGIVGIVRAWSLEDAYECCEDEIFPRADEDEEDFVAEFGDNWVEDIAWQESYGFSPSNGIYAKDLNGDYLDLLTNEMLTSLGIRLVSKQDSNLETGKKARNCKTGVLLERL